MLRNYLLLTIKVLQRRKFFTFVNLFGISFTLMVLVLVIAFLDHAFTPMGTEHKFDRALVMEMFRMRSPDRTSSWQTAGGYQLIDKYIRPVMQNNPSLVESFAITKENRGKSTFRDGEKIRFSVKYTEPAFFDIVDLSFVEGQPFMEKDNTEENQVAVISQAIREMYFRGESAIGKDISFDGQIFRVVGVVENVPEVQASAHADVWVPLTTDKNKTFKEPITSNEELIGPYQAMILLHYPEDRLIIKKAVREALSKVEFPSPEEFNLIESAARNRYEMQAVSLFGDWEKQYQEEYDHLLTLSILAAMGIFMLLPSINLINLNLSRMMERRAEIGVRRAFGASIGGLLRQFVIENVFISLLGGLIGIILSTVAIEWLNNSGLYKYASFSINYRVLIAGILITIIFGLLSGVYPAWRMAKLNPIYALKGGKR